MGQVKLLANEVYFSKTINSQIILVLEEMVGAMKSCVYI